MHLKKIKPLSIKKEIGKEMKNSSDLSVFSKTAHLVRVTLETNSLKSKAGKGKLTMFVLKLIGWYSTLAGNFNLLENFRKEDTFKPLLAYLTYLSEETL